MESWFLENQSPLVSMRGGLHPLANIVFGVVTALAFLKTRTLWLPIVIHVTHNGLVWMLAAGGFVFYGESTGTQDDFQASWWLGVTGLVVGVPLPIRVLRRKGRLSEPRDPGEPGEP